MTAGQQASANFGAVNQITISSRTVHTNGNPALAQYILTGAGDIQATDTAGTLQDVGDWLVPKTNMGLYSVFATLISGTLNGGTTGSWLNLGSGRNWTVANGVSGTLTAVIDIKIRHDSTSATSNTARITLEAQRV